MGVIIKNKTQYSSSSIIVELTQAEYDALSTQEKNSNVFYCITDVNGDEQSFQPIIYSTEEREIGVWTDGKPLYQRTWIYTTTSVITSSIVIGNYDVNTTEVKVIVGQATEGAIDYLLPYVGGGGGYSSINTSNGNILFGVSNASWGSGSIIKVTIQYTKTTDTPGSGIWTPSGVPAVHYSTNEQVVGTWVDGSTVYEKSYEVTGINADYNYIIDANFTQSAIKLLPGCSAVLRTTGTYNTDFSLDVLDDNSAGIRLFTNINGLNFNVTKYGSHSSHYGTCSAVVTIRYTKTTT